MLLCNLNNANTFSMFRPTFADFCKNIHEIPIAAVGLPVTS